MEKKYIAHVFKLDCDESEFVFPIGWYGHFSDDEVSRFDASSAIYLTNMFKGFSYTGKTKEFDVNEEGYPGGNCICAEIRHSNFAHGAATIYVISGPEFDRAMNKYNQGNSSEQI